MPTPALGAAFSRGELSNEALCIIEAVEQADALIAVSPVYKGSYTGLFKHLFDLADAQLAALLLQRRPVPSNLRGSNIRAATAG